MRLILMLATLCGVSWASRLSEYFMDESKRELLLKVLEQNKNAQQPSERSNIPTNRPPLEYTELLCTKLAPWITTAPPPPPPPPPPKPSNLPFCTENGNVYTPVDGCRGFDQRVGFLPPSNPVKTHNCPPGLLFDTKICVCNYPGNVRCSV